MKKHLSRIFNFPCGSVRAVELPTILSVYPSAPLLQATISLKLQNLIAEATGSQKPARNEMERSPEAHH